MDIEMTLMAADFMSGVQQKADAEALSLPFVRGKISYCEICAVLTAWLNMVTSAFWMSVGVLAV